MKLLTAALLLLAAALPAHAQEDGAPAQKARIAAERQQAEQRFEAEQLACRGRFAVTDCIAAARRERNAALSDLRRQELVLNREERLEAAAQRQRELDERAAQRARPAAPADAAPPAMPRTTPSVPKPQGEPRAPSPPKEPNGPTAAEAARNRAEFEQRRLEAERHKEEVRARLARRAKPAASSLPPP